MTLCLRLTSLVGRRRIGSATGNLSNAATTNLSTGDVNVYIIGPEQCILQMESIDWIQYRTCYSLLKELQERIQQIIQRLVRSHMGDPVPSLNLHTVTAIAIDLHHTAKLSAPGRKRLTWSGKECVSVITRESRYIRMDVDCRASS
jgi:hypothetical protein